MKVLWLLPLVTALFVVCLLGARQCTEPSAPTISGGPHDAQRVLLLPLFHMRETKTPEDKQLVPGHSYKWQSWDLSPGSSRLCAVSHLACDGLSVVLEVEWTTTGAVFIEQKLEYLAH